ncbi:MAG: tripartite tricarboxylate transporter TctB family protein [Rhodobacteraceae bacterium]|nr:tripartite tricarboxylate transporter TctB family protein [Paracoccaceae bacterium]
MTGDRYFGAAVLAITGFYLYGASTIPTGFLPDPVGSRTFPYILGGLGFLCGFLILLRPDDPPVWPSSSIVLKLALAAAIMYGFAETLQPLGFILPSAVTTALLSYLIAPNILHSLIAGGGLSVGLYVILKHGLGLGLSAFWF